MDFSGIEAWIQRELGEAPNFKGRYYFDQYERLFEGRLRDLSCIVELGVAEGASLLAWSRVCPKAVCIGVDRSVPKRLEDVIVRSGLRDRVRLMLADHNEPDSIASALSCSPDLLVDDGSHLLETTRACFLSLFESVRPGGWYAIEDWGAGYWEGFGGPDAGVHRFLYELVDMLAIGDRSKPEAGRYRLELPKKWPIEEIRLLPALAFVRRSPAA
jgi:hypothetical protein